MPSTSRPIATSTLPTPRLNAFCVDFHLATLLSMRWVRASAVWAPKRAPQITSSWNDAAGKYALSNIVIMRKMCVRAGCLLSSSSSKKKKKK